MNILITVALYLFCLCHISTQKLQENEQQVTNCDQAVHFVDFIYLKPKVCKQHFQSWKTKQNGPPSLGLLSGHFILK